MTFRTPNPSSVARTAATSAARAATRGAAAAQHAATVTIQGPKPAPVNPLDQQAATRAQHDIAALIAGLPSAESIQQPYAQRGAAIDSATQNLLSQLRGEQTYRVNLATGLPEAQKASDAGLQQQGTSLAAALGGQAAQLPQGDAGALASFGTSAANQVAQQMVTAPLAGMQYHAALDRQMGDALNQRSQAVAQAQGQLPSLTDRYLTEGQAAAQAARQFAFQQRTAQQNYDLATGKALNDASYRTASLRSSNARTAATIAAQNARATAGRDNAWKIAQARIAAQKTTGDATATKSRNSSLAASEKYIDGQLQSRYKSKAGTAGGVTGYSVTWTGAPDITNPGAPGKGGARPVKPEQWQAYVAGGKKDPTLLGLAPDAIVGQSTAITKPGTTGQAPTNPDRAVAWAVGYLSQQNGAYGWGLDRATLTRMAQQSVRNSGLWPNFGKVTRGRPAPTTPPKPTSNSYNTGRKPTG